MAFSLSSYSSPQCFSVTLCLWVHLACLLFLSPSLFFILSLFLSVSDALVAMRAVCGKQLSTLSQIIKLILCKYSVWWRCAHVLQRYYCWTNHNDQNQNLLFFLCAKFTTWRSNAPNIGINLQFKKCAVCSTCSNLNALALISEARSSMTGICGCRESVAGQVSSCQREHRGCKQCCCDISPSWVTDVQLHKVAFMTRGEGLSESGWIELAFSCTKWQHWEAEVRCERKGGFIQHWQRKEN